MRVLLFDLFQFQDVMSFIHLLQADQLVTIRLEAAGNVFNRLAVIQQYLDGRAVIYIFQSQLGLDKIRGTTDSTQVYHLHEHSPFISKLKIILCGFQQKMISLTHVSCFSGFGNSYLGCDNLWSYGLGYRVFGKLAAQVIQQRLRSFLDDRVTEPDAAKTFGLLFVPFQYAAYEIHNLVFGKKGSEQGAHQGVAPPLAANAHGVAALCLAPGTGGTDLDAVAAPDAGGITEYRFVVLTHDDCPGYAALGAQTATDAGLLVK